MSLLHLKCCQCVQTSSKMDFYSCVVSILILTFHKYNLSLKFVCVEYFPLRKMTRLFCIGKRRYTTLYMGTPLCSLARIALWQQTIRKFYPEDKLSLTVILGKNVEHIPEAQQLDGWEYQVPSLSVVTSASLDGELLHRQRLPSNALFELRRVPAYNI